MAEKVSSDWKWAPRPLEIFPLLLKHLCKRDGYFYPPLDSCQSLAGKQNRAQLLWRGLSSYWFETFGVHGGEQCWASTASMVPSAGAALNLSAADPKQLLGKQRVLSLRALPCRVSTWIETRSCWKTFTELVSMAEPWNFQAVKIKRLPLNKPG